MPTFTPPPPVPQRGARSTFSAALDAFLRWLAALPAQLDVFLAQLSTLAAGGANAFSYVYDASAADGDPGTGQLRLGAIIQNTATMLRINPVTAAGANIAGLLAEVLAGTSALKASIRLQKRGDPSKFLIFDISTGTGTGYLNIGLVPRASSAANPFVEGDDLMVFIDKKGDKGDVGNADKKVQTAPAAVAGVVTVDYRNGNCLVWAPTAGTTTTLNITNWPAAGTLGEFWIIANNAGAASTVLNTNFAVNWLRPDGTYANNTSITVNHGVALRPSGEDNVLLWGRTGAPTNGKIAR